MASRQTNDSKREVMKGIIDGLLAKGWTRGTLALRMNVTPSAVSAWSTGRSMGTNDQRAILSELPAWNEGGREQVVKVLTSNIAFAKDAVAFNEKRLADNKAKMLAESVNGIHTYTLDYSSDVYKAIAVTTTDMATGKGKKVDTVTVIKAGWMGAEGKVTIRETEHEAWAWTERQIAEGKLLVAKAEKALAGFLKQ